MLTVALKHRDAVTAGASQDGFDALPRPITRTLVLPDGPRHGVDSADGPMSPVGSPPRGSTRN
jgi:hypothetical protein